jgi:hypothetical protein
MGIFSDGTALWVRSSLYFIHNPLGLMRSSECIIRVMVASCDRYYKI